MKTRILSLFLCVLMLVSMVPVSVSAAGSVTIVEPTDFVSNQFTCTTSGEYWFRGDFPEEINIKANQGLDVVFNGSEGTFAGQVKFSLDQVRGSGVDLAKARTGSYVIKEFDIPNSSMAIGANSTTITIQGNEMKALDMDASNTTLVITGNTINSDGSYPRYGSGTISAGIYLYADKYDLTLTDNRVTALTGNAVTVLGEYGIQSALPANHGYTNSITMSGNTFEIAKEGAYIFRTWNDITYAPVEWPDEYEITDAMQSLAAQIVTSNTLEGVDGQKTQTVGVLVRTSSGAGDLVATENNLPALKDVAGEPVAMIGDVEYRSLDAALAAATAGDTVQLFAGEYDKFTVPATAKGVIIAGTLDKDGNKLTTIKTNNGDVVNTVTGVNLLADDVTFADLKFVAGDQYSTAWFDSCISFYNENWGNVNTLLTVDNCDFVGSGKGWAILIPRTIGITVKDSTITNFANGVQVYGLFDQETVTITNSVIDVTDVAVQTQESDGSSTAKISDSEITGDVVFGKGDGQTGPDAEITKTTLTDADITITGEGTINSSKLINCTFMETGHARPGDGKIVFGSTAATANYFSDPDAVADAIADGKVVGSLYPYYADPAMSNLINNEGEAPHTCIAVPSTLTFDETHHWYSCSVEGCTLKVNYAPHDFGDDGNAETCAVCGADNNNYVAPKPAFDYVLFALAARYAQRYDVLVSADNATVTGDMTIKYKRSGTVDIAVAEGYQLVDVIANGQSLGAVTSVTFKKVMAPQTLVVVTEPIPTEEPAEETPAA